MCLNSQAQNIDFMNKIFKRGSQEERMSFAKDYELKQEVSSANVENEVVSTEKMQ